MQSVFKFHIALATLHQVDEGKLSLDKKYKITKEHYFETCSVLMREYPEVDIEVTLKELITWTVMNSDNVACDILFEILGGPTAVENFTKYKTGIETISIVATEREMHADWNVQLTNWTTPNATAQLLKKFTAGKILSKESTAFLWKLMMDTPNAPKRLKGLLPEGSVAARKPGTGSYNDNGVIGAVNDVGILVLPNGRKIVIAIFVTNSKAALTQIEYTMATISRIVYDHYNQW
jgi:beta-lactamase class A